MNNQGILYEVEINQGNLKNVAKACGFGTIEVLVLMLGMHIMFELNNTVTRILMIYFWLRIVISWFIPQVSRSVVTHDTFLYYYPKRLMREQEILTIPFKDIVKVTETFNVNQSIYITYMQDKEIKKLQIYAFQINELGKLQKLYNTLINESMYITYRSKEKEQKLQIELEKL